MTDLSNQTAEIDGIAYAPVAVGCRRIVVRDRGWVFVGVLDQTTEGVTVLTDASNVRNWSGGGFGGLTLGISTPVIDRCADVVFATGSEIFKVRVSDDWGQ